MTTPEGIPIESDLEKARSLALQEGGDGPSVHEESGYMQAQAIALVSIAALLEETNRSLKRIADRIDHLSEDGIVVHT